MGGPCEVLAEVAEEPTARKIVEAVAACAWRIEDKFSRYRGDNIVARINASAGAPVEVDEETANLLDFAALMHRLSDGLFDITSGVLRRAWTFDGGNRIPSRADIDALLPLVGWSKLTWERPVLTLRPGMQIDFGGIGKEYVTLVWGAPAAGEKISRPIGQDPHCLTRVPPLGPKGSINRPAPLATAHPLLLAKYQD